MEHRKKSPPDEINSPETKWILPMGRKLLEKWLVDVSGGIVTLQTFSLMEAIDSF